jgi:CDP-glucose 4,6-dehydratase
VSTVTEFDSLRDAFHGKRVLVTGHTGFKGSWLSLWLSELGAIVSGFALQPESADGLYPYLRTGVFEQDHYGDIRDRAAVERVIRSIQPDYVFHLAAQPLVRLSYSDPIGTLSTNVLGSAIVLDAVRQLPKTCHTTYVTSDKCYQNREWCYSYRENDRLGGKDPYSMSKAAAELIAEGWRRSYFDHHPFDSVVISVRAGNVIGGGDYAADRLIPDCLRAALSLSPLVIRSPRATRPWQHVLDCLHGYMAAAARGPSLRAAASERDARELESFNFGPRDPHDHPVAEVAEAFFAAWPQHTPGVRVVPAERNVAEAGYLSVSIEKAQRLLNWQPTWDFATAIAKTVDWYVARHVHQSDMLTFSRQQLADFEQSTQRSLCETTV